MSIIKRLSLHEAQKIAAGQVVDRPANVVKELVENSLDAQASAISVFIQDGGKELIRVVDNGCGMDQSDALLCFEKHATSKIVSIDDLPTLTSFGFRGEALASIAAVSKVTLLTKQKGQTEGVQITAQEGALNGEPVACPEGTDISAHTLFYNVPVREKFLKKQETETRSIIQLMQAFALAYPHVHFKLTIHEKLFFNCPPQDDIVQRVTQLWDSTTAHNMLPITGIRQDKGISIFGAISNHHWFRYDRSSIFFLVNNRWVMNHHLGRALMKGYDNVIPHGRYPMACISIMINPAHIDINVHPRKEEVKFANPRIVEELITHTVRKALETHLSKQIKRDVQFFEKTTQNIPFKPASSTSFDYEPELFFSKPPMPFLDTADRSAPAPLHRPYERTNAELFQAPQEAPVSILEPHEYTLIGQYNKTYILIEQNEGLFLIDQHAAHERILYELFVERFKDLPTITLMFPQLIPLSPQDVRIIEPHLQFLHDHGILIESFGQDQLIIQSTPVHLKDIQLADIVKEMVGWLQEYESVDREQLTKLMHDKLRAQMACKAAVKAGDVLSRTQMEELLKDLHKTPNRFSCPHGRPTGWLISLHDIEKKFRRKL